MFAQNFTLKESSKTRLRAGLVVIGKASMAALLTAQLPFAQAGPVSNRATVLAPVSAVAIGPYSNARVVVASGESGSHSATIAAPVVALSLGAGTTASVSIASSTRFSRSYVFHPVVAVSTWRPVYVRM